MEYNQYVFIHNNQRKHVHRVYVHFIRGFKVKAIRNVLQLMISENNLIKENNRKVN